MQPITMFEMQNQISGKAVINKARTDHGKHWRGLPTGGT
jgi:hypothetical protein